MSHITADAPIASPGFGHAWRQADGTVRATVFLNGHGLVTIFFSSSADADAVIAATTEARDALAALEAEGTPPDQPAGQ